MRYLLSTLGIAVAFFSSSHSSVAEERDEFSEGIAPFMQQHCLDCHGDADGEAGLDLTKFKPQITTVTQADGWLNVLGQLQAGLMPPLEEERPNAAELARVMYWIEKTVLASGHAEAYRRKILLPAYGNLVDHDLLFSGKIMTLPYTPARVWRRSPYIFDGSVGSTGKAKTQNPYTYSTPKSGVRDYARTSFVGASVVETIVLNANAEIDLTFDQLTGGAERDRKAAELRAKEAEAFKRKVLNEAQQILNERDKTSIVPSKGTKKEPPKASAPKPANKKPRRGHTYDPFLKGTDGTELTEQQLAAPLKSTFQRFASRDPTEEELQKYVDLLKKNLAETKDPRDSLKGALIAIYLSPEAIYRQEWGLGPEDEHGRRMLAPEELAFALSFALFDTGPFTGVKKGTASSGLIGQALANNQLNSREDVVHVVEEILSHPVFPPGSSTPVPRLLRFFHEFLGYDRCGEVFKDGHEANLHNVYVDPRSMTSEADALMKVILRDDRNVFERMLSSSEMVVKHSGVVSDGPEMERQKQMRQDQLAKLKKFIDEFDLEREKQNEINGKMKKPKYRNNPKLMANVIAGAENAARGKLAASKKEYAALLKTPVTVVKRPDGKRPHAVTMYNMTLKDWKSDQPLIMPEHQRAGVLTHPAWLVAHSFNAENDPVRRGIWVYEKLLAGYIADVPPDVDAQVPEDHTKTLRERMELLRNESCWKCHHKINPLGEAFEIYNHYGRWIDADYFDQDKKLFTRLRTFHEFEQDGKSRSAFRMINHDESVESGKLTRRPVNARGSFDDVGIPGLSGEFADATEMCRILAKSPRVRQSIIRHAFRYFMGRNELLSDSKTLIEAEKAYIENGGSFKALVISLLSSDSFLYRK
jgi:hypothetical protein